MKITISNIDILKEKISIEVSHKESSIFFIGSSFNRKPFEETDPFDVLNRYLRTIPETTQDKLFKNFVDIKRILEDAWNKNELIDNLQHFVENIYNLFDFEEVRHWVSFNLVLPELEVNFAAEYKSSMDDAGSRDQTYLRSDYIDLVTLSLLLRLMVPIWNEFIDRTKKEYGVNFKEYYAFRLLRNTYLYHHRAMEKLRTYISFPMKNNFNDTHMVLSGISTEDIPTWMLSLVVIRRLVVGKIENNDPSIHLITYIYKYVLRKSQSSKSTGSNVVKDKKIRKNEEDDEKESSLDRYKIKYNISSGEIVEIEYALKTYEILFKIYFPNYTFTSEDYQLLNDNINTARKLLDVKLESAQVILLSWVMAPISPPRGLIYVNKETLVMSIGVAQTIFWKLGFNFLAFLISAWPDRENKDYIITGADMKYRINKDINEELEFYFPYVKRTGRSGNIKQVNPAITTIYKMYSDFNAVNWLITAKKQYIKEIFGDNYTHQLVIPSDLRVELAKCLIQLINIQNTHNSELSSTYPVI